MEKAKKIKKVVLLGACGGIGRQLAERLAQRADQLLLVGRDESRLRQAVKELAESPAQLDYRVLDMRDRAALEQFAHDLEADLLINCSGLASLEQAANLTAAAEADIWQVNCLAPIFLMKQAVQSGSCTTFVQLSSLAAICPHPYLAAYSASKAALHSYCLSLQEELRQAESAMKICVYTLGPTQTGILPQQAAAALGGGGLQLQASAAAAGILKQLEKERTSAVIGARYRLLVCLMKLLPQSWQLGLLGHYLRKGLS
ncbi:short-chain dehydrogenase/reductase SDR [Streptococcus sp. DD11]|uniref:SDR family NAD(P)-dependent oxidoreductase n=1 Tax=Streptococcus sp. DD11 TaxID=1777879 RepID=UPI00079BBF68|nr:SDR family NAD(P)-dependent oxidoreductase [Streptococcus sp. DD11]KXT78029.1 short-chain dehydrogenase/reductase SDR [Streptococcus sp. DD11]